MSDQEKAEKLFYIFDGRFKEVTAKVKAGDDEDAVHKYMRSLVPHVKSIFDQNLWYLINEGPLDAIAVRDPSNLDKVIVVEREYADKVLVLGLP